jgi:FAD/FMN-containing dehydrogenase
VTGTCECVSLLGPGLGGGHGWLQGHYGLVADQFVSMNVVLANGSLVTLDETSELWWAVKGAGHNFGIVTSVTSKVYDIEYPDWAIETIIFSGDQVQAVYEAANEYLLQNGTRDASLINWSYWLNIPTIDAEKVGIEPISLVSIEPANQVSSPSFCSISSKKELRPSTLPIPSPSTISIHSS